MLKIITKKFGKIEINSYFVLAEEFSYIYKKISDNKAINLLLECGVIMEGDEKEFSYKDNVIVIKENLSAEELYAQMVNFFQQLELISISPIYYHEFRILLNMQALIREDFVGHYCLKVCCKSNVKQSVYDIDLISRKGLNIQDESNSIAQLTIIKDTDKRTWQISRRHESKFNLFKDLPWSHIKAQIPGKEMDLHEMISQLFISSDSSKNIVINDI